MSKESGFHLAKGHTARIIQVDEETILLPLNGIEVSILLSGICRSIRELHASRDFPEKEKYENLKCNLQTALMLAK